MARTFSVALFMLCTLELLRCPRRFSYPDGIEVQDCPAVPVKHREVVKAFAAFQGGEAGFEFFVGS